MAVTIDDLPIASMKDDTASWEAITSGLLRTLRDRGVPAYGFVNEGKCVVNGVRDPRRVALLARWLAAGLELGNHSYSHKSLHALPLADYQTDVARGEAVLTEILRKRRRRIEYYRHPFLQTGLDLETKTAFERFLAQRHVRVAPVTIDNAEWIYARAFEKNPAARDRIGAAYLDYMEAKTAYWERQSVRLFGREVKQVLLIHANALNAAFLGALLDRFRARGYDLIPLHEALEDPAYSSPDVFVGRGGISWLHRWALSASSSRDGAAALLEPDEPSPPSWLMEMAGVASE